MSALPSRLTGRRRGRRSNLADDCRKARRLRLRAPALALLAVLAVGDPARAAEPEPVSVDLLVLYTPGASARYGSGVETRIRHLLNVSNDIFRRSEAGLRLRLAHSEEIAYSDSADSHEALTAVTRNEGVFTGLEARRSQVGADLVVLMRPYVNDGICGVAWLGGYRTYGDLSRSRRYGYSHVSIDCSDVVLSHELGHNMGLSHSRRQNGEGATFPWALGHGVDGSFVTVMAYAQAFGAPRVSLFASPDLRCNDLPCGVDHSDPLEGADAVHTLQYVRGQIAAYTPEATAPAPLTDTELVFSAPAPGPLPAGAPVTVAWRAGSGVASVDLLYRLERRRAGRWKKTSWRALTSGETDGRFDWVLPHPPRRKVRTRVRLLLRGYDHQGEPVAAALGSPHRLLRR